MVTILQVSRQAGVSTATVSRVINNPEVVGIRTRERVQEVIERLGYRPNLVARDLASRSSRTIGVVINNFSSVYYGLMLEGVELALRKVGYKTIAESSQATSEGERQAWFSLLDRQCDGVVVHSDNLEDDELATHIRIVEPLPEKPCGPLCLSGQCAGRPPCCGISDIEGASADRNDHRPDEILSDE